MPLVLSRTAGQAIILDVDGRKIRVEVARVSGREVRLSVTAPKDVAIWREEAVDR
jgi:carbon storage regulator CsrA